MVTNKISQTVKKLLHDPDFIMWCLMPTEELDKKWELWQELHPELSLEVKQARVILKSTRLNEHKVSKSTSQELWLRLEHSLKKKSSKRNLFFVRYAAACIVLLLLSVSALYVLNRDLPVDNSDVLTQAQTDTTHTEVTLIIGGQDVVQVEDNALIAYDSDITVQSKGNVIKKDISDCDSSKVTMNTLVVPRGRRSSLLLADGSRVWVNSGSVLHFPSKFDADKRLIDVEGEIYIEVVKNEIPFQVRTDDFTVNVLGTKFNISSYADEQESSVVLVEGCVFVNSKINEQIRLVPNQKLSFMSGKNKIETVDVRDYISWKDGMLQFKKENMSNILMRLSRYYNIPIKCTSAISKRRSSGKLVLFDDIEQVMKTLSMLYDIHYRFESDTLLIE
ncbi:FecR domain-containing protein [uncultured Parabacteroides sp.]|jgi:transmembrane sensor|uniref:FecR family protein n=1 Tax=uncultured Parabacteroides sp. TaxID=512312 RepID=UPI0025EE63D0|nr:FecR domain-containing protein [uncultured Parabacteroides sp.]